jgi:uncharacterized protein (DUF952 family)
MRVLHVLSAEDWRAAQQADLYGPAALQRDGFLHCCTDAQLPFVLARHFAGAADLVVIAVASEETPGALCWVRSEPDQPCFSHLHGPILVAAVKDVQPVAG